AAAAGHPHPFPTRRSSDLGGLTERAVQWGLGYAILPEPADTSAPNIVGSTLGTMPVDLAVTEQLAWDTYRYAGLLDGETAELDRSEEHTSELQSRENLVCR